jgi:FkbM family methyltransferase
MQSKISKYIVNYFNEEEFHSLKREIFTKDSYYFESDNPEPLIIDIGAYIGISVLYFKHIYPNSRIIAFEPNPTAVEKLNENMFQNGIENVGVHSTAILDVEGSRDMYIDDTGMDRFSVASFDKDGWNKEVVSSKLRVKTEKLDKYIQESVDLLKIDAEGSEQKILKSIKGYFDNIKNIILEYHPTNNQNIDTILNILKSHYSIEILHEGKEVKKSIPKDRLLTIKATCKG